MVRCVTAVMLAGTAACAWAGENGALFFNAIPTLDEVGLGARIALVASAAGWAVRRRNRR